ncbi:DUF4249 domain-containing protein [Daejeonella sp.]|uniref:DUF4249 domain-containing protein n=1 Tax=Daejeonella sp. TaxID=2805397 RepID=UPI0030BEE1F7
MRKILSIISTLTVILFSSCEKIVNVDLETQAPRLIVDAALIWVKGTDGKVQTIKLTTTTGYYQQEMPKVSNATVYITNSANVRFDFLEEPGTNGITGRYTCIKFIPKIGETYTLTVIYKGETYEGKETLIAVNPIENVEQRDDFGLNRDEYGIKVNFRDPVNQNNYYLFSYKTANRKFPSYDAFDDQFIDGNLGFGVFADAKSKKGDSINIKFSGISQRYFNYMKILIGTSNADSNGIFATVPSSNIRGNMINKTNGTNYCLGYFSFSETDQSNYILK